jgi:hypothetical protein
MARIRTIKPDFFRHEVLQDLEAANPGRHVMLVFAALWGHCDKLGRFEWRPRQLKLDILPFLEFDMTETLTLLCQAGLLRRYEAEGKQYGLVETFEKHQRISGKEAQESKCFPGPQEGSTGEAPEKLPGAQEGNGVQEQEGKGRESAASAPPTPSPTVSPKLEPSTVVALRQAADVDDALEIPTTLDRRRGSRLPPDWEPSLEMLDWAQTERPDLDLGQTLEKFRDYWISQPGQKGVKTDWTATYRNWVRNEKPGSNAPRKSATTQAADALIARFAND